MRTESSSVVHNCSLSTDVSVLGSRKGKILDCRCHDRISWVVLEAASNEAINATNSTSSRACTPELSPRRRRPAISVHGRVEPRHISYGREGSSVGLGVSPARCGHIVCLLPHRWSIAQDHFARSLYSLLIHSRCTTPCFPRSLRSVPPSGCPEPQSFVARTRRFWAASTPTVRTSPACH